MSAVSRPPQALLRWSTYLMGRLHRTGVGRIGQALADAGWTLRDYYVLACIDEGGEMAQQQVADRLDMDRSDLVKVLDRLENAGCVVRTRDPVDRRRHVLSLTDEGRATIAETEKISQAVTDELLAGLSKREQSTLHKLLLKAFEESGGKDQG